MFGIRMGFRAPVARSLAARAAERCRRFGDKGLMANATPDISSAVSMTSLGTFANLDCAELIDAVSCWWRCRARTSALQWGGRARGKWGRWSRRGAGGGGWHPADPGRGDPR